MVSILLLIFNFWVLSKHNDRASCDLIFRRVVCAWNAIWQRNIDGLESCQTLGRSKLFLSTTKVEIEELSLT